MPDGMVSFVIDDGRVTDFTVTKPVFDVRGAVAVSAVITRRRELDDDQLRAMAAAGWEIASHGRTHADETTLDEPDLEDEIGGSRRDLEEMGLSVTTHVYPYGAHDDLVERVTQEYFDAGVTAAGGLNRSPLTSRYALRRANFGATYARRGTNSLIYHRSLVDKAKKEGGWLVYMVHALADGDVTLLEGLLEYIQGVSMPIVTVRDGLRLFK